MGFYGQKEVDFTLVRDTVLAMRIFQGTMHQDSETDMSIRWIKAVDGVPFKLYIYRERVPNPVPRTIDVSIFKDESLYTRELTRLGRQSVKDLTSSDRAYLSGIGLDESQLVAAGGEAILGAAFLSPRPNHTETVRYNSKRKDKELEFGDPYIPKSILTASW